MNKNSYTSYQSIVGKVLIDHTHYKDIVMQDLCCCYQKTKFKVVTGRHNVKCQCNESIRQVAWYWLHVLLLVCWGKIQLFFQRLYELGQIHDADELEIFSMFSSRKSYPLRLIESSESTS